MSKRKLIGVIIDALDADYEKNVGEHLGRSSVGKDVNLLFFSGSDLKLDAEGSQPYQTIYDLPNMKMLDGVILVLSSMIHHFSSKVLERLLKHMKQVPMVSLSIPFEGAFNVILDNDYAMTEVIHHMRSHHPMKDICYIAGPSHNNEALVRSNAYRKMREESGLTCDDTCYYEGDFSRLSGMDAVDYYVEKNGCVPKAIVSANDDMAIGAYQRLSQLGFNVPEDVSISGFDNIATSKDFFPPMTTYDQHFEEMCETAFAGLIQLMEGQVEPKTVYLKGELIIRESCGCPVIMEQQETNYLIDDLHQSKDLHQAIDRFEAQLNHPKAMMDYENLLLVTMMPSQDNHSIIKNYANRMIRQLLTDLRNQVVDGGFLKCVGSLVNHSIITEGGGDLSILPDGLRQHFLTKTVDQSLRSHIEAILVLANQRIMVGIRRQEKYDYYKFRQMYMLSRNAASDLNNILPNEGIFQILQKNLPYYGIDQCYVVQYKRPVEFEGEGSFIYPMMSDLVFAYEKHQTVKRQSFVTHNMLPTNIIYGEHNHRLLFVALHTGNSYYGYMVFGVNGIDTLIYETIRSQISEAIKNQQMTMKRLESELALNNVLKELELSNQLLRRQSIKDDLTGLYNRRGFYQEAEFYFRQAEGEKDPFFIIFGDIDGLKQINDRYGHNEGDYAIRHMGQALEAGLPSNAIVARMSGDEFTALVGGVDEPSIIEATIEAIQKQVTQINEESGKDYKMSISLGYAVYDYEQLSSMDDLLRLADSHLYREKKRNKKKSR